MTARMASAAAGALLALGCLAGCGSGDADPADSAAGASLTGPAGVPTAQTASPLQPTANESISSDTPPPSTTTPSPGARATPIEVTGTVSAVKDGCLLFTPGDMAESWVLIGKTKGLKPGDRVRLGGVRIDTEQEGCPMGLPFDVSSVERVG